MNLKECRLCHRVGERGFIAAGGENHIWECSNDRTCRDRASRRVERGTVFRHLTRLDPAWKPGPGQKYADAPKQLMRVTRMTRDAVWYVPADSPAGARAKDYMTRETWDRDYAPTLDATLAP